MDPEYEQLTELNADLVELMYGERNPVAMTDQLRHPLEDVLFTFDEVMGDSVRLYALGAAFGLYMPPQSYRAPGYFYLALKSILYGERHGKYPRVFPSPGEMHQMTQAEFLCWIETFWAARKTHVPEELLFRLAVDGGALYGDRMSLYLYYSTEGTDQDPFESTRVAHHGEAFASAK